MDELAIRKTGYNEGKKEGVREGIKTVASKLLKMGTNIEEIIEATGLTKEEIIEIENKEN